MSLDVGIYSADSKPFGLTFSEWIVRWWQWLLSIPKETNPAMDTTGENACIGQLDPNVFFLCQTIESVKDKPRRRISVLKGRCIFMPILNWVSNFYEHGNSEEELIQVAKKRMNTIGDIQVTLNGRNIQGLIKHRYRSDFFVVELPESNILELPPGKARLISEGYWLFTKAVVNDTKISTFGSCSSGLTKIAVDYSIKVI